MRRWAGFLLLLPLLGLLVLWVAGPALLQPAEEFPEGPGGAVAYISLYRQFQAQTDLFRRGKPFEVSLNEAEASGILRSAVLSGWSRPEPPPRMRARLRDGMIQLELILNLTQPRNPRRFSGPIGVVLHLVPEVDPSGPVRFRIQQAAVGRIPLSAGSIRRLGGLFAATLPGFDPAEPALALPFHELVIGSLDRTVSVQHIWVEPERLRLQVIANRVP